MSLSTVGLSYGRQWESSKLYLLPVGPVTATISVVGELLTCQAPVGESAKASRHINVKPGETITFQVMARLTAGTKGDLAINYPDASTPLVFHSITSSEWQMYELSCIIPVTAEEDGNCVLQSGVFGASEGTVEFMLPRVSKGNCLTGSSQNMAMGQIYFDGDDSKLPKINVGFANNGIYDLSYDIPSKTLSITLDKTKREDPEGAVDTTSSLVIPVRPLFFGNVTFDNGGAGLTVQFSGYDFTTGIVEAMFFNGAGTLIDIETLVSAGNNIFFNFKAEVN